MIHRLFFFIEQLPLQLKRSRWEGDRYIPALAYTSWRSSTELAKSRNMALMRLRSSPLTATTTRFFLDNGPLWKEKDFSYINKLRVRELITSAGCPLCGQEGRIHTDHLLSCPHRSLRLARDLTIAQVKLPPETDGQSFFLHPDLHHKPEQRIFATSWANTYLHYGELLVLTEGGVIGSD